MLTHLKPYCHIIQRLMTFDFRPQAVHGEGCAQNSGIISQSLRNDFFHADGNEFAHI